MARGTAFPLVLLLRYRQESPHGNQARGPLTPQVLLRRRLRAPSLRRCPAARRRRSRLVPRVLSPRRLRVYRQGQQHPPSQARHHRFHHLRQYLVFQALAQALLLVQPLLVTAHLVLRLQRMLMRVKVPVQCLQTCHRHHRRCFRLLCLQTLRAYHPARRFLICQACCHQCLRCHRFNQYRPLFCR